MPPDEEVEIPAEEIETPEEEIESDDEPEDGSLSDAETKEAQNLYKLLKNPGTQKSVLRVLAEQAGVLENPPSTPEAVRETKKDFKKILEDKLGPDLKWLVPKLGDALEEMFDQEREEQTEKLASIETKEVTNEVMRVSEKLNRESKGEFKKFENRMNQLADEILPAPNMSVEKYMRHLYAIAASETRNNNQKNKLADKINRNANNASERVRSIATGEKGGQAPDKPMTLKQAVAFAANKLEKD